MFGQLVEAVASGSAQERATAVVVLVSTASAVALVVGTFAAVFGAYRGLVPNVVLLGVIAFAVCWMAFVLLGDLVLARLFGAT